MNKLISQLGARTNVLVTDLVELEPAAGAPSQKGTVTQLYSDASGVLAINRDARMMNDSGGLNSVDWQNHLLGYATPIATGNWSVDWFNEILADGGVPRVDWYQCFAYDAVAQKLSINWELRLLQDTTEATSLDWAGRQLKISTGITVVDWNGQQLLDDQGFIAVDWVSRVLKDATSADIFEFGVLAKVTSGIDFQLGNAATTGLTPGVLAATTNASIVILDSTGTPFYIPCIAV